MQNHELVFIKLETFNGFYCKIYKCKKCNYELYTYPDDNYSQLYFLDNDVIKVLSCEEMIIKKLLE